MRPFRRDFLSMVTVLAVLVAVVLVFPFDAIGFVPKRVSERRGPFASFVTLTDEEHAQAMRAAKTSWQGDSRGVRRLRVDLSVGVLPEDSSMATLDVGVRPRRMDLPRVDFVPGPSPDSVAARPVPRLPKAVDATVKQTFSKAELLRID